MFSLEKSVKSVILSTSLPSQERADHQCAPMRRRARPCASMRVHASFSRTGIEDKTGTENFLLTLHLKSARCEKIYDRQLTTAYSCSITVDLKCSAATGAY